MHSQTECIKYIYKIPPVNLLINAAPTLRKKYTKNNPKRLLLISIFETLIKMIHQLQNTSSLSADDYHSLYFSPWIYCISAIETQKRKYETLGSLYSIIGQELQINEPDKIDDFDKLHYLTKLYYFLKDNINHFNEALIIYHSSVDKLCDELIAMMRALLQKESVKMANSLEAIPTENALDTKMRKLPKDYEHWIKEKSEASYISWTHDPNHQFLAQLIAAISQLTAHDVKAHQKFYLSRSERIKLGAILYTMRLIYDEYILRSATNAGLYALCQKIINEMDIKNIDSHFQATCIAAFFNFLDAENIKQLEKIIQTHYIDIGIVKIKQKAPEMIRTLSQKPPTAISTVTASAAIIGGAIASIPSYGTGYTIGYIASEMDNTLATKIKFSQITGKMITVMFGNQGQCLGYFVSNMVVDIVLERAFAKVFELLGILLGAGVGAGIGIIIYDVSYKTLRNLCQDYCKRKASMEPNLARNIEPQILQCLLELPSEVFKESQKERLREITQLGIFSEQSKSEQINMPLNIDLDKNNLKITA